MLPTRHLLCEPILYLLQAASDTPLPTVVEPEPQQEEGLRARRSSLTSSFRAGLRSLRSSLRRQLGGSPPPPPVPQEPAAILEDGEPTVVSVGEAVQAAVEAAVELEAEAAAAAAKAKAAKEAATEKGEQTPTATAATAAPPSGETPNHTSNKPASRDESIEESGRRNFTAVSIDQCEDEKERTRL